MRLRLFAWLLLACAVPASAETLDADAAAGRALFVRGVGVAGTVMATLGAGQVPVRASSMPCASCHGRDGRGRPEGAVVPPDITWPVLGAPGAGKRRGYDAAAIIRAVTLGVDVEGRPLDPVMPRYRLSLEDASHLTAYLQTLGTRPDPGLTPDRLVLGTIQPREDTPAGAVLRAFIDRLDEAGGLFGRRVELVVVPAAPSPEESLRRLIAAQPVFALVAPWIAHDEHAVAEAAETEGVPLIGAETLFPDAAGPMPRYLFFLDGGIPAEARILAQAAGGPAPLALVEHADLPAGDAAAAALGRAGTPVLRRRLGDAPEALAHDLAQAGIGRILWLAPGLDVFAAAAARAGYRPALLAPAELGAADLPATLAFRVGPGDQTAAALEAYRDLAAAYHLPDQDRAAQLRALASIRLLVDALERAGHDATRESLVAALEADRDFRPGLVPPLSYGPSRRIGSTGVWLLRPGAPPEWRDQARN